MNETLPGMTPDEFRRMTENGATAWAGVDPAVLRAGGVPLPAPAAQDLEGLAHQIYSAAQLAPGEGVTDAVDRIAALLGATAQEPLKPLSPGEVGELLTESGYDEYEITPTQRAHFINGLRSGEIKHGITGAAK